MRGHIQQRGPRTWRIKAYLGRDGEGRKRYLQRTVAGSRRDAERELSRLLVEVDEGRHAAAGPLSFGELLDRWLEVKRLAVEPTTMSSYEWVAGRYLRPALGERRVASLRPIERDALYASLRGSGLSARTVRICHTVVRQSLEQARKWGSSRGGRRSTPLPRPIRAGRSRHRRSTRCSGCWWRPREDDPEFGAYLWCWPPPAAGGARAAGCGGPTSTWMADRW